MITEFLQPLLTFLGLDLIAFMLLVIIIILIIKGD